MSLVVFIISSVSISIIIAHCVLPLAGAPPVRAASRCPRQGMGVHNLFWRYTVIIMKIVITMILIIEILIIVMITISDSGVTHVWTLSESMVGYCRSLSDVDMPLSMVAMLASCRILSKLGLTMLADDVDMWIPLRAEPRPSGRRSNDNMLVLLLMYIYIYNVCVCTYMYVYIYIYIERER